MSIKTLFDHFDNKTSLYIDVNEVKRKIIECGFESEIYFHFVNINEARVRGYLRRTGMAGGPYTESSFRSDIYIARTLDQAWRRVVAVKELLHIIDTEEYTAASHETVDALLENMALPSEVRKYQASYLNDRIRLISAIAILVPVKCRAMLRECKARGIYTNAEIQLLTKIPSRFVPYILEEEFEEDFAAIHKATDGLSANNA